MSESKSIVKALILTGGKSTRMGTDKYLLEVNGLPQYQYLYDMATETGIPAYISCSGEQKENIPESYPIIVDQYENIGPIGGLASAIQEDSGCSWMLIACDLINLNKETLLHLLNSASAPASVIAYRKQGAGYFEATLAIYKPVIHDAVLSAVKNRKNGLQSILKAVEVKTLQVEDEAVLANANSPEDLE